MWVSVAVGVVFGFAYGGIMPLYAILVREYFGTVVPFRDNLFEY